MPQPKQVIVEFVKSHKCYNAGDRAGFTPDHAKMLCENGIAKPAGKSSVFNRPKKSTGQKLDPGSKVRFFIPKEGDAIGTVVKAPSKGPVIVEYDGAELKLERSELAFVAPPPPEPQTGDAVAAKRLDPSTLGPEMVPGTPVSWVVAEGESTHESRGVIVDPREGSDTVVVNYGESDIEIARDKLTIIDDDRQGGGDGSQTGDGKSDA